MSEAVDVNRGARRSAVDLEPQDRMFVGDLAEFLVFEDRDAEALALLRTLSAEDQAADRIRKLRTTAESAVAEGRTENP